MKRTLAIAAIVVVALAVGIAARVSAQGPATSPPPLIVEGEIHGYGLTDSQINYQGHLYNATGTPLPGSHQLRFTICTDGSSQANCTATQVWQESQTVTADTYGRFNALLGAVTPLTASHFRYDSTFPYANRYLMIEVNNGSWIWLQPNQRITSVAIAIGNIRKNTPDTTVASVDNAWLLTVQNTDITPNPGAGLLGISVDGIGLRGNSTTDAGVVGYSSTGWGVFGQAESTTVDVMGVLGICGTTIPSLPAGTSAGVLGSVETGDDYGVLGINWTTTAQAFGVLGLASTGTINQPTLGSVSVLASASRAGDHALYASNSAATDSFGVIGVADSTVYGVPPGTGSTAVSGNVGGSADWAVIGRNPNTAGGMGVYAYGYYGVYADSTNDSTGWAGYFHGYVYTQYLNAEKSLVVTNAGGQERALYTIASPENWFEDFGTARLLNGKATVTIDPLFAETVNLDQDYHIFLTPLGDCQGLYVVAKTSTSFEVRELGGGKADIAFDYRIVGRRAGYEQQRMEVVRPAIGPAQQAETMAVTSRPILYRASAQSDDSPFVHSVLPSAGPR